MKSERGSRPEQPPRTRRLWFALKAALLLGFGYLKIKAIVGRPPIYSGDLRIWAAIAEYPLLSRDFWLARRPIVFPLVFKTGLSDEHIVLFQLGFSTLCWAALALALSGFAHGIASLTICAATLLIALSTPVHAWDAIIRAESTSHSLVVLSLACALYYLRALLSRPGATHYWAVATGVFSLVAAFARDTNSYLLLLLVPTLCASVWAIQPALLVSRRTLRSSLVVLCFTLLAAAFAAQATSRASGRYDFPLMNVIFRRVLPNPHKLDYFARELGMPLNRQLLSRRGTFASSHKRYAFREPALQAFRDWIAARGYTAYQRYLVNHPLLTAQEAYEAFPFLVAYRLSDDRRRPAAPLGEEIDAWIVADWLPRFPLAACIAAGVVSAAALLRRAAPTRVLGLFGIFFVLTTLSQLYVCFHGDAMEVQRHSVAVGTFLRLAVVVSCGLMLAALLHAVRIVASLTRRALASQRATRLTRA
ncbi:MAG: hypothetical protein ACOY0T_39680 [Myxococcota bacterium]